MLVMDWNRGFCGVTDEFPASATEGQLYTVNVPIVELNQTQVPEEENRPQSAAASDQPALADGDAEEAGPGTKEAAGASKGEQMAQQDKGGLQRRCFNLVEDESDEEDWNEKEKASGGAEEAGVHPEAAEDAAAAAQENDMDKIFEHHCGVARWSLKEPKNTQRPMVGAHAAF